MRSADVILPPLAELRGRAPLVVVAPARLRHSIRPRISRSCSASRRWPGTSATAPHSTERTLRDARRSPRTRTRPTTNSRRSRCRPAASSGPAPRRGSELDAAARAAAGRPPRRSWRSTPTPASTCRALIAELQASLPGYDVIDVEEAAARPIEEIDALIGRNLTDDRVFGVMGHFTLDEFYDDEKLAALAETVADSGIARSILVGWGAALDPGDAGRARARRPGPLGDPAAPAPRGDELAHRQRRRRQSAQVQARLLRRMARRRPSQARACSTGSTSCSTRTRASARPGSSPATPSAPPWRTRRPRRCASCRSSTPASGAASG